MDIGCVVYAAVSVIAYVSTVMRWAKLLRPFVRPLISRLFAHVAPARAGALPFNALVISCLGALVFLLLS